MLLVPDVLCKLRKQRKEQIFEAQWWFRPDRNCTDQTFTYCQVMEHRYTYRRPIMALFMSIKVAFDSVGKITLWDCLLIHGIKEKYMLVNKPLYHSTSGRATATGNPSSPSLCNSTSVCYLTVSTQFCDWQSPRYERLRPPYMLVSDTGEGIELRTWNMQAMYF